MALKIISFIFIVSLAFGVPSPNQVKNVPFDLNDVINRVSTYCSQPASFITSDSIGEFLIDTTIFYAGAPNGQYYPAIAFDGTNYLVVWQDERSDSGLWDIYGARITPDGIVLDRSGIPISIAANIQLYPSVAFDGYNYLVVWEDYRSGSSDIYGARVSPTGTILDPNGFLISMSTAGQGQASVTFNDSNYLVVWQDNRNGSWDIYGTRVTISGIVLDTTGIPISTATSHQISPSVASDDTNYLVVWTDWHSSIDCIYGARITTAGTVLDDTGFQIATIAECGSPSVIFGDTQYLVVWHVGPTYLNPYIYGARVTPGGVVIDTAGFRISPAYIGEYNPVLTFDGINYFVVWKDLRRHWLRPDVYGTRITQAGVVLDSNGFLISMSGYFEGTTAVAFDGTNYLVARSTIYEMIDLLDFDIIGVRLSPNGMVIDTPGFTISTAANSQMNPSVAFDSTNYLVVWQDNRNGNYDIYASLVDQNGVIQGQSGFPISTATNEQSYPSVAFNGTDYLVVWQDYRSGNQLDIYGARLNQQGIVLDSNGFAISTRSINKRYPCVSFDGLNYLVVWQERNYPFSSSNIYCARVNQQGVVLDPNGIAIINTSVEQNPAITFDGTNYLVVWDHGYANNNDIYGTRVSPSGNVLDPNGFQISTAPGLQYVPSGAFDGTNYFVVWFDKRNSTYPDIYGARVSPAGTILDPNGIPISIAENSQINPAIEFDGNDYLVVWEDYRRRYDLYGAKVNTSGVIIDSFPITTQINNPCYPALARGTENQILITYSKYTQFINNLTVNTYRIWGKLPPYLDIEENCHSIKAKCIMLDVYPNPAKDVMRVRCPWSVEEKANLIIFDILGKLVKVEKVIRLRRTQEHKQEVRISLKGINPGIYFLQLGKEVKKFIVAR